MATRKIHRLINTIVVVMGVGCAALVFAMVLVTSAPRWAFSHTAGDGRITFHAAERLPPDAAQQAAALAWATMQDTPFGAPDHSVDVYITGGSGWRHYLFFRPAPWAGGLTYPILSTRAIFLRDVDLAAGRLIGSEGPIPDPRDLTYYLVHEITHLRHSEVVGPLAFLRTPHWVREGIPDLAALGPAGPDLMRAAMAGEALPRDRFGSYPLERACVSMVLASGIIGIEDVLEMRVPMRDERSCFTLPTPFAD